MIELTEFSTKFLPETKKVGNKSNVLSLAEISQKNREALYQKLSSNDVEEELQSSSESNDEITSEDINVLKEKLLTVENIDLASTDPQTIKVLLVLFESGHENQLISKLTLSNLKDLDKYKDSFISYLIQKGFGRVIFELLPDQINPQKVGNISFLAYSFDKEYYPELLLKLPETIAFPFSHESFGELLVSLVTFLDNEAIENLLNRFKSKITSVGTEIKKGENDFFSQLLRKGHIDWILDKLPEDINFEDITKENISLFEMLLRNNQVDLLLDRLPKEIDFTSLSSEAAKLLTKLLEKKTVAIDLKVTGIISLNKVDKNQADLLSVLIYKGFARKLLSLVPNNFSLSNLDIGAVSFLKTLVLVGLGPEIINKLPDKITLSKSQSDFIDFFKVIARYGLLEQIIAKIDLEEIALEDEHVFKFLEFLLEQPDTEDFIKRILDITESKLRKPIETTNLDYTEQAAPYLFEIIEQLPIIKETVTPLKNNWFRALLRKDGSLSYIYINTQTKPIKIIFRTDDIPSENIRTYQQAVELLPNYVTTSIYQELSSDLEKKDSTKIYKNGFREVFSGVQLESIDFTKVPQKIADDIKRQRNYILLNLRLNGIDHGHAHDRNFNVRFLLSDRNNNKQLIFDMNYAIQLAQQEKLDITPIVTLRDWDQAIS